MMDSRRRRISRLYLRKHFRRSLRLDRVERTIQNKSISIISISSTDTESFNRDFEDSENEIISPSPNKYKHLKCPSSVTQRINRQCKNIDEQNEDKDNSGIFKDISLLHYDNFKTPLNTPNHLVNSTMLCPGETEEISLENSELHVSETGNKSLENMLDNIYGESWRPFKEKVLPKSERKAPKKKLILPQVPATERNKKSYKIQENPIKINEKFNSYYSLKGLQMEEKEGIENCLSVKKNEQLDNYSPLKNDDHSSSDKENLSEKSASEQCPRRKLFDDEITKSVCTNEPTKNSNENLIKPCRDNYTEITAEETSKDIQKPLLNQKTSRNSIEIPSNLEDKVSSPDDSIRNVWSNVKRKIKKRQIRKIFDFSSSSSESQDEDEGPNKTDKKKQKSTEKNVENEKKCEVYKLNDNNDAEEKEHDIRVNSETKIGSNKELIDNEPNPKEIKAKDSKSSEKFNELNNPSAKIKKKNVKKTLKVDDKKKQPPMVNFSHSEDDIVQGLKRLTMKNQPRTLTFLASLSNNVSDEKCDPSAKVYRVNFKNTREELARILFNLYNKEVFNNKIPKGMSLEWNARMLCTAGYCCSKKVIHKDGKIDLDARIVLSSKVLTTADRLRDTLIHEMCHAATYLIDEVKDGHGKYWKAWTKKAKTAFPELPPIKTCHNYEINSKYTYKCSDCGYSIRRHRKSLDIERKRCGYCLGKFELFINKVNKKGEKNLVPADTPKKQPTGFALFVQENYSKYKNMNSAQAMKLLSKDFKEIKQKQNG